MGTEFHYDQLVSQLRETHASGKTKPLEWRREQLQNVIDLLTNHEADLVQALHDDLSKPKLESLVMEIHYVKNDAIFMYNNLADWMRPTKADRGLVDMMHDCHIRREPYGVALIISPWNYPVQLVFSPLIGAIAAGNCAVVKPSEISSNCAKLFEKLIKQYLDNECIVTINGGIPETTALLRERFDIIFYTGNSTVAKIVLRAAAEHLTPVVLELGGKSPVYVDDNMNLSVVARRLMWGKCTNSGQTCIAPDYVMCSANVQDELIKHIKDTIREFFGDDPKDTPDFGRIISERQFERLSKLIDGAQVACGGEMNKADLYIAPTIIKDVKVTDDIMKQEIFGPLLPIVPVKTPGHAIDIINSMGQPLALYIFSNDKKVIDLILNSTSSGGVCVNDTVVQVSPLTLPFGGVGHSGMGRYHGWFSFDAFSHQRSCLMKDLKLESINSIRYPPYTDKKINWVLWLLRKKQKRVGMWGFLPFMLLGTLIAFSVKMMTFMS